MQRLSPALPHHGKAGEFGGHDEPVTLLPILAISHESGRFGVKMPYYVIVNGIFFLVYAAFVYQLGRSRRD